MKLTHQQAVVVQLGIIARALEILMDKRLDYSGEEDPYGNFRRCELRKVPAWLGCMVRNDDKFARRETIMARGGKIFTKDDPLLDSWADSVNYVCIEAGLEIEILPEQIDWLEELHKLAQQLPSILSILAMAVDLKFFMEQTDEEDTA